MARYFAYSCFAKKNNKIVAKINAKVEVVFSVCGFLGNVGFSVSH